MEDVDLSSIMVQPEAPSASSQISLMPESRPAVPTKSQKVKVADPPQDEDPESRGKLASHLQLYFDIFPELKHLKPKNFDRLSEEELEKVHKQIHHNLGAKGDIELAAEAVPTMVKVVEDLAAEFTPLRIQGTHAVCATPHIQKLIKYALIDAGFGGISCSPQQKLALALFKAAATQHFLNSALEKMTPEQRKHVADTMARMNGQTPATTSNAPATAPAPKKDDKYADL